MMLGCYEKKKNPAFLFFVHTQKETDNPFSKIVHSINEMEVTFHWHCSLLSLSLSLPSNKEDCL